MILNYVIMHSICNAAMFILLQITLIQLKYEVPYERNNTEMRLLKKQTCLSQRSLE